MNIISKTGYWFFIIVPVVFLFVSAYSYISVLNTFGEVPATDNALWELAEVKGLPITIFPTQPGLDILQLLMLCYLSVPFFLLLNYFLYRREKRSFHKKFCIAVALIYPLVLILIQTEFFGWYFSYLVD